MIQNLSLSKKLPISRGKGLVHRDIKPGNILMTRDGVLKVTDFGIARWGEEEKQVGLALARGEDDTRTIGFIGTKHYASPEQWRDAHAVGPETDVFSFGVCLWEMLCGRRPYSVAAVKEAIPDPRTLRPGLPEGLYTLLTDLVAFEVETRQELGGFESLRERFKVLYQELFHEPSPHSELERLDLEADGLNNRGVSYLEMGKAEAAVKCWEAALQKDSHHLGATFNLGYWEWGKGRMTDDVLVNRMRELEGGQGASLSQPSPGQATHKMEYILLFFLSLLCFVFQKNDLVLPHPLSFV